ncbi:linearmycin/streptolysin S transport system ATP-binding protein [Cytobacillus horneckiae]
MSHQYHLGDECMNVLEINQLTKKFGQFIAVDGVSLAIMEGEIFGFLGANGAGKSTTINMIAGLLKISKGEIKLLGKDLKRNSKYVKKNIGLVPQDIAIYEDLTALENVKFFAGLYGLRGNELNKNAIEALDFVGLGDKQKSYPKSFSGGMKRRLNIACAIAHQPKLIIMDEPTVGIDPQSRKHILESVKKLNSNGCTIIYTSHYMEEVEAICSRIAIIDHGKVIAEGSKEQLISLITDAKDIQVEVKDAADFDLKEVNELNGVRSVQTEGNVIQIYSDAEVNNLNEIILHFMKKKVEIRSLKENAPNLETVFLTLTGRKLRD